MCIATPQAVVRACAPAASGLSALSIIDPDDLTQQPVWFRNPSVASLSFKSGKAAYNFEADRLTARLTDRTITSDRAGDRIEYLLQARVSGITPDIELFRAKMLNRRVHVAATYQSGGLRLLPYMRLSADGDSGDRSNRNGYAFSGSLKLLKPAPFIGASFNVIDGPYIPPDGGSGSGGVQVTNITTTSSTYTYQVPAGKLLAYVWLVSDEAQTPKLGLTAGGDELGGPYPLDADQYAIMGCGLLRPVSATNIYFSGLSGTNTIEIWLLSGS